jgi:hypothetical protein
LAARVKYNGFRSIVLRACVVHWFVFIIILIWLRFAIWYTFCGAMCSSSVNVDCGALSPVEALILLQT